MSRYVAFNKALRQATAKPSDEHHRVLLDEGMHLVTASCMSYLTRLGNVNQTIGFTRRETALAGTLAASSLGLAGFSANAIAGTASAFGFTTATMENFSDVYLFAPDLSAVQALVLTAMESRIEQGRVIIDDTARELSYSEVSQFLLTMESTCQPHGIQGLVTRSVASTSRCAGRSCGQGANGCQTGDGSRSGRQDRR